MKFSPRMAQGQPASSNRHGTPTTQSAATPSKDIIHYASTDPKPGPPSGSLSSAEALSVLSPNGGDRAEHYKAMDEEKIVGGSLVLFLKSLTRNCPGLKGRWFLSSDTFVVRDYQAGKAYEARMSGMYADRREDPRMGFEVKPFSRIPVLHNIRMQEAAQVAAWIAEHPPKTGEKETHR